MLACCLSMVWFDCAVPFFRLAAGQGQPQPQARTYLIKAKANEALAAEQQRRTAEAEQALVRKGGGRCHRWEEEEE